MANQMKTSKYSKKYSFVKNPVQSSNIQDRYNARDKQTNEIWLARVIHLKVAQKYKIQTHIQYNEQCLDNLKQKGNIIYVKEIFYKDNQTFIIQEKYQKRLSDYLQEVQTIQAKQVQYILQNIFMGVCDIYQEGYIHRNVRPEHVVMVQGDTPDEDLWKIQTLVFNNQQFDEETPYMWKKSTASPEQRLKKGELDEQKLDSQVVWNFGYLAVQLLMGNQFMKKKMIRDSDILWNKIKQKCLNHPNLYNLIEKCFRLDYKDRISLNNFFDLQLFENCGRLGISQYFLTASSIFKVKGLSSIQSKIQMKNRNMMSINFKDGNSKPLSSSIEEQQQNQDQQDAMQYIKASFLSEISNFITCITIISKSNQISKVLQYYFKKLAIFNIQKSKQKRCLHLKAQLQKRLLKLSSQITSFKVSPVEVINKFYRINTSNNMSYWIEAFNELCGYCYSRSRQECQKKDDESQLRSMAYFIVAAYMINSNNWAELKEEFPGLKLQKKRQSFNFVQEFNKIKVDKLVKMSQELALKHFKIIK